MSESLTYSSATTIVTDTIITTNVSVNLDLLDQWPYLTPSTVNAPRIIAGLTRLANNYINDQQGAFWSNASLTYTAMPTSLTGVIDKFVGGCQLPDGRIIMAPWNASYIGIFNTNTNNFTTLTITGTGTGTDQFQGCVLSPDGRVIFVPSKSVCVGIFNPVTNSWSTLSIGQVVSKYSGGCVIPDGRILFFPDGATNYGFFDPITDTFTTVTPTGSSLPGKSGLIGGCLYPDGRIIHGPGYNYGAVGIYNIATNVFTTIPSVRPPNVNGEYDNAVLIPDGRVAFIPRGANPANLGLFDPRTNAFTTIPGPSAGNQYFISGCALPDGRVVCSPSNSTYGLVFNTFNNTFTTITGLPGSNAFNGLSLLKDGRIVGIPTQNNNIGIFSGFNQGVPSEYILHPFFNQNN